MLADVDASTGLAPRSDDPIGWGFVLRDIEDAAEDEQDPLRKELLLHEADQIRERIKRIEQLHDEYEDNLRKEAQEAWEVMLRGMVDDGHNDFATSLSNTVYRPADAACEAVRGDNREFLEHLINKHPYVLDHALAEAAHCGYLEMVKFLIDKGARDLNGALREAAHEGHQTTVEFLFDKGARDLDYALQEAARGGHQATVEFLVKAGAQELNWALREAARSGCQDLVDFLIAEGADDLDAAVIGALWGRHFKLAKYFSEKGGRVPEWALAEITAV